MKALITGASSGIGKDIARILHSQNISLIITARNTENLKALQTELGANVEILTYDLSVTDNAYQLYKKVKSENIDILINNAGFGLFGDFDKTCLSKETDMINLNITSLHILTKLFLKDFKAKNSGYILNVASSAGLMPGGPLMATYYASKSYVVSLTNSISEEIKNSNVSISALCPGPVDTNFNNTANVHFSVKPLSSQAVAAYAIKKMFEKKRIIIPGIKMKAANFFKRFLPDCVVLKCAHHIQRKKI